MGLLLAMPKQATETDKDTYAQRLDKWLWYARVTKSRTLASALIQAGKVRINRIRSDKPSHVVKVNDVITVAIAGRVRVLKVLEPGSRRGPAVEAAQLYEDLTPAPAAHTAEAGVSSGPMKSGGQRPTKRDRRVLDRLRHKGFD